MNKKPHQVTPSVYLLLIKDEKILLIRRCNTGYEDGNYGLVAGHMEQGEVPSVAMVREAREEAGIALKKEDLNVVHVMIRKSVFDERVDFFMVPEKWEGTPMNMEPNKCDDMQWFPLQQLPDNTIEYIRAAIEYYQKGVYYSDHGWD